MKTKGDFPASIFFLCVVAVCGSAWGATVGGDAETSGRNLLALEKGCGCADVARTEIFRTRGLEYTTSREFADAVVAVATGASDYSPSEIPVSWRSVAAEWSASVETSSGRAPQRAEASASAPPPGKAKILESAEACAPALLYLASLEYRARIGNDRIAPVFPRVARASTRDFRSGLAFRKGIRCFND